MDVLSEVLRVVRLTGVVHFRAEFTHPWAISSPSAEIVAARYKVAVGSVTPFHIFIDGGCWVTVVDLPPVRVKPGDVILLPHGPRQVMASNPAIAPVPTRDIYTPSKGQVTVVKYGGGGARTSLICGFLHSDQQFDPLFKSLPAFIRVRTHCGALTLETLDDTGRREQPMRAGARQSDDRLRCAI
jgi:AraC family transcriptional regulator, alkane utilization regulator